jgi:predicted tellurium resistance membrane protein TerC
MAVAVEVILLELILALSTVWYVTFLSEKLPIYDREKAQFLGLFFAWSIRILLLLSYPTLFERHFTLDIAGGIVIWWPDVILFIGGVWILIWSAHELFISRSQGTSGSYLNVVLCQGTFVSSVLGMDSIRAASHHIEDRWAVAFVVVGGMIASQWLSPTFIGRFRIAFQGPVFLLFSTGLLIGLEAFHQPLLSELICIGVVIYLITYLSAPGYGRTLKRT